MSPAWWANSHPLDHQGSPKNTFFILIRDRVLLPLCVTCDQSRLTLTAAWTAAGQAPLPREVSRREHWSGMPFPTAGDLPNPGIEPKSFASPAFVGRLHTSTIWEAPGCLLLLLLSRFSRIRLCDPIDGSPPASPVPGAPHARTLEWGLAL